MERLGIEKTDTSGRLREVGQAPLAGIGELAMTLLLRLQTTLDLNELLSIFRDESARLVDYDGFECQDTGGTRVYLAGRPGRQRALNRLQAEAGGTLATVDRRITAKMRRAGVPPTGMRNSAASTNPIAAAS